MHPAEKQSNRKKGSESEESKKRKAPSHKERFHFVLGEPETD